METKNYFSTDAAGNILPSATCYVYVAGTTDLATGLVNINGAPLSNPFTAQPTGLVQFKAPDGEYDLRVTKSGRDFTIRIQCFDGAEFLKNVDDLIDDYLDSASSVLPEPGKIVRSDENGKIDEGWLPEYEHGVTPLEDYDALRAYNGSAKSIQILKPGIYGTFFPLAGGEYVDDGAVTIIADNGQAWRRPYTGLVFASWFEVVGDGIADDSAAMQLFWSYLASYGRDGRIDAGKYLMSAQVLTQLTNSFAVYVDSNAEFIADEGFPAGAAMFAVGNALVPDRTFKWVGGRADISKQPFSTEGSGSGCSFLSVNASNCSHCHVEIDRTYSGPDWLNSGSDSHLFIGGPRNIFARIYEAIGAPDCAIYISRNFAGNTGESLDVDGNFYKCQVGVIVKRQFETGKVNATAVDCVTGAAIGQADISGYASTNGGSGFIFEVNAKRCENPVFLQAVRAVRGVVNCDKLGVSITGYTSVSASAARFRGATDCQFDINVSGMNPNIAATNKFCASYFGPINNAKDGTLNSTGNLVRINARGIGIPFEENTVGTNNNTVTGKVDGLVSNAPIVVGAETRYILQVGNIELFSAGMRKLDAAGKTLFNLGDDGSLAIGGSDTGVAAPAYIDFKSSGTATRSGRIISTGGTSTADSGVLSMNAAQVMLNTPAVDVVGVLRPSAANGSALGTAGRPFSGGAVQTALAVTSDENHKTEISEIPDELLDRWEKVDYQKYKMLAAVEAKGDAARWHFGVIAQRIKEALGQDAFKYGVLCFDEWPAEPARYDDEGNLVSAAIDSGSRYSVRYEEALALEAALMRRAVKRLEARIAAVETHED